MGNILPRNFIYSFIIVCMVPIFIAAAWSYVLWWKSTKRGVPISLIIFVILAGTILIVPNGIDARYQRPINFSLAMLAIAGLYVAYFMSVSGGFLILWSSIVAMKTVYAETTTTMLIMFGAVTFFIAVVLSKDSWKERKETIYDVLILIVSINLAYQILQLCHITAWPVMQQAGTEKQLIGLMSNINETSALYALCLPAFLRPGRFCFLPLCFSGLALSLTTTGVLAASIVLMVWAAIEYRKYLKYVTIAVIVACLVYVTVIDPLSWQNQKTGRLYIWQKSIQAASIKNTGWGFGQYEKVIPIITSYLYIPAELRNAMYQEVIDKESFDKAAIKLSNNKMAYFTGEEQIKGPFVEAHNEFVEWWFISGIVGFVLMIFFLLVSLYRAFRHRDDRLPMYGLISASVCAFFGFPWHIMSTALITVLYFGIVYGNSMETATVNGI